MSTVLDSYVVNVDEAYLFVNKRVFVQMCFVDAEAEVPGTLTLSGTALERAYRALNFGKEQIDSLLSNIYSVPFTPVSETFPSQLVKSWTVKFAMLFLMQLHDDRVVEATAQWDALLAQIEPYTKPDGPKLAGHERTAQVLPRVGLPRPVSGTVFDRAGFWSGDVIRDSDGPV